jgi:hypothetical protein
LRCADDDSVTTFDMTTLRLTGHIPAPIEVHHPRPFNRPPMGAALIWEEEEEEEEEEDNFAPAQ